MRSGNDASVSGVEEHERLRVARRKEHAALDARYRLIGTARLLVALGTIALLGAIVWAPLDHVAYLGVLALGAIFIALAVVHVGVDRRREDAATAITFHDRALARMTDQWRTVIPVPTRTIAAGHRYASDVDLVGKASVVQWLDVTATKFGEDALLGWLLEHGDASVIRERQEAAKELAPDVEFRERLHVLGARAAAARELAAFFTFAESKDPPRIGGVLRAFAIVWPCVILGSIAYGRAVGWPAGFMLVPYFVGFVASLALRGITGPIVALATSKESAIATYAPVLDLVEKRKLTAPALVRLRDALASGDRSAARATSSLATITGFLDALGNEVFRLFFAPFLMWELNGAFLIERWRARYGGTLRGAFEALGALEALSSFAGAAFENPEYAWPEIAAEPCLVATGLAHPLLAKKTRVANDVTLAEKGKALLVTGSNMSGKSTLMRAVGVNVVLALAGAPVCAKEMKLGVVRLATSMRVEDSLAEGTSHFYAELLRLKLIVDESKKGPVLFLLDEILHGTNSRERILGARAVVRDLLAHGALGAVSTHDLGLSDMEKETPDVVKNVHFQEQVEGEKMTFDYRLREGVVQSSNALRLMKALGLPV